MTREELIELGKKIVSAEADEQEIDAMMDEFNQNVPYPGGASLFFYPENYNARTTDLSAYNPTVEEVVDKCLSYKPFML